MHFSYIKESCKLCCFRIQIGHAYFMEKRHWLRIQVKFGFETLSSNLVVLEIPDDYQLMDPELVEEIRAGVNPYLK